MREEDLKGLKEALNALSVSDYESGRKLAANLALLFNCFGSCEKTMGCVYEGLSKKSANYLTAAILLGCLSLASEWMRDGRYDIWDDRKKACCSFSYKNKGYLEKRFHSLTGISVVCRESSHGLLHDLDRRDFKGKEFLLGFLDKWVSTHPTLQQSIVNGFVGVVENGALFLPPLDYKKVAFPFI